MNRTVFSALLVAALMAGLGALSGVRADDPWPRFRGTTGNSAVLDDPRLPERWSATENVHWAIEVPGVGWSSPVIWGKKVFVTTVVNDESENNDKPRAGLYLGQGRRGIPSGKHHWWVFCYDLETGRTLWKEEVLSGAPKVGRHPKSSYAAETPVVDGERLYALFGDHGMYCFDLDGNRLWTYEIEPKKTMMDYGAAASPVVHGDQVFFVYDNQETSYLAALDAKTGKLRWRVLRDEKTTWATPYIWEQPDRTEIVVPGKNKNRSYDLQGNLLWEMEGRMSNLVIPSPFEAEGLVYLSSGYFQDLHRPAYAIRPGATGDITLKEDEQSNDFIQWYQRKGGPYNTTPLVYKDLYFLLLDRGMMSIYDAKTGEQYLDRKRFPKGASFTVAPWAYNGKVFCLAENGKTYVLEASKEFKLTGTVNDLDDLCMSCPAISDGRLVLRTQTRLYCLGNK
ncbi:MAG: PQQ-binding-like beta-propeller repeat protein [Verrucomicrobiota bacterium]